MLPWVRANPSLCIGNAGVGLETTRQLALHGARVYIASRSEARVNEAISKMRQFKSTVDVRFLKLDLQDLQSVKAAVTEFMQKESRLDILINNAGVRRWSRSYGAHY